MNFDYKHFYNNIVRILCDSVHVDWAFPYNKSNVQSSIGSGFFISDRYILTCSHVVEDATFIHIEIPTFGKKKYPCKVKGICPYFDIALIEVEDYRSPTHCQLEKDTSQIQSGDSAIALGYPLGQSNLKITNGIISGQQDNCFQIDTPINPGNSGGPLIRDNKVIGINSAGVLFSQNIGYSVPIDRYYSVKHLLLQSNHTIVHFPETFGFQYQCMNQHYNDYFGASCQSNQGVLITKIIEGSLISTTQLSKGDILCKINDHSIDQYGELNVKWMNQKMNFVNLLATIHLDTNVKIEYWSHSQKKTETFTFTTHRFPIRTLYPLFEPIYFAIYAGLIIQPMNLNISNMLTTITKSSDLKMLNYQYIDHRNKEKIIISNILNGSMISQLNVFTRGECIRSINGHAISSMKDVYHAIRVPPTKPYVEIINEDGLIAILMYEDIVKEHSQLSSRYRFR